MDIEFVYFSNFSYRSLIENLLASFEEKIIQMTSYEIRNSPEFGKNSFRIFCRDNQTRTLLKHHLIRQSKGQVYEDDVVTVCKLCPGITKVYGFRQCQYHGDEHGAGIDRLVMLVETLEKLKEHTPGFLGI